MKLKNLQLLFTGGTTVIFVEIQLTRPMKCPLFILFIQFGTVVQHQQLNQQNFFFSRGQSLHVCKSQCSLTIVAGCFTSLALMKESHYIFEIPVNWLSSIYLYIIRIVFLFYIILCKLLYLLILLIKKIPLYIKINLLTNIVYIFLPWLQLSFISRQRSFIEDALLPIAAPIACQSLP